MRGGWTMAPMPSFCRWCRSAARRPAKSEKTIRWSGARGAPAVSFALDTKLSSVMIVVAAKHGVDPRDLGDKVVEAAV